MLWSEATLLRPAEDRRPIKGTLNFITINYPVLSSIRIRGAMLISIIHRSRGKFRLIINCGWLLKDLRKGRDDEHDLLCLAWSVDLWMEAGEVGFITKRNVAGPFKGICTLSYRSWNKIPIIRYPKGDKDKRARSILLGRIFPIKRRKLRMLTWSLYSTPLWCFVQTRN